jgi:hypothetical protein
MDRVDQLSGARNATSVKFLEFTRVVSAATEHLASFFEGEDYKYYAIRLVNIRPEIRWTPINCHGRKNVLQIRDVIRNHPDYADSRCAFFVDRDFENCDLLEREPDVYITPGYSVENLYVGEEQFSFILESEFDVHKFGDKKDCYEKAIRLFRNSYSSFNHTILDFNVWLYTERKQADSQGVSRLNLGDLKLTDLVQVGLESCTQVAKGDQISALFPDVVAPTTACMSVSCQYFNEDPTGSKFRGKQQFEFLRTFLTLLKQDSAKNTNRLVLKEKKCVALQLSKKNLLSEISQYAVTPDCLRNFVIQI